MFPLSASLIFTLIAGIALLKVKEAPEEGQKLSAGINAIQIWVMKWVRIVIALTPCNHVACDYAVLHHTTLNNSPNLLGFIGMTCDFHDVYVRHLAHDPQR